MILTAHQPSYLPWLGLLHKISEADEFVSWDDVPMESSGFENRQRIIGGLWLTVPVHRKRDTPIREVTIANEHDWRRKHYRAIEQAYRKATHWVEYEPHFRFLYLDMDEPPLLVNLTDQVWVFLCREYGIERRTHLLSALGTKTHKGEQVLEACKKVGATKYIFGAMGKDYANARMFREQGVEPLAQTYAPADYRQGNGLSFEPRLWAYDALLWLGRDGAREAMLTGGKVERMP